MDCNWIADPVPVEITTAIVIKGRDNGVTNCPCNNYKGVRHNVSRRNSKDPKPDRGVLGSDPDNDRLRNAK